MRIKLQNRYLAFLLAVSIFLSNMGFNYSIVRAEEAKEYIVNAVIKINQGEVKVPDSYITIKKGNDIIQSNTGKYMLEKNVSYTYTIQGEELSEMSGDFSVGEDEAVNIFVDKKNLQLNCLDSVIVGEKTLLSKNELKHDWKWESSNSQIAEINQDGVLKAVSEGSVIITQTSKKDSDFTASKKIIIEQDTLNYTVKCYISDIKESVNVNDNQIVITEKSNNTIIPVEKGKCKLKYNTLYTYSVKIEGIEADEKAEIITPLKKQPSDTDPTIVLKCNLVAPKLKINGIEWDDTKGDDTKKIKRGTTVNAVCSNYDNLWDKENWKVKINGGEERDLNKESFVITVNEVDNNVVFIYKAVENEIKIPTFDNHKVNVKYNENTFEAKDYCFKDKDGNVKKIEELETGKEYILDNLKGFTFKENCKIIPDAMQECITLEPLDIVKPEIFIEEDKEKLTSIEKYYGESVTVKIKNEDYLYDLNDWVWECVLDGDSKKTLPMQGKNNNQKTISLTGDSGTYIVRLRYKESNADGSGIYSKSVSIIEKKTVLDFKKNNEGNNIIVIDAGTHTFTGKKEITVNCLVSHKDVEKTGGTNTIYPGKLEIKGTIQEDVDVCSQGEKTIKITEVCVKDENGKELKQYDVNGLIGQIIKINIEIQQAEIRVKFNSKFKISYHTNEIRWEKMSIDLIDDNGNNIKDKDPFINILKQYIFFSEDQNGKFKAEIEEQENEKGETEYVINNKNCLFKFDNNQFEYEIIGEIIRTSNDIKISMIQGGKQLKNIENSGKGGARQWISLEDITTSIGDEEYGKYYKKVFYSKIGKIEEEEELQDINNNISLCGKMDLKFNKNEGNEKCYKLIISDEDDKYPALAAFIRIIKVTGDKGSDCGISHILKYNDEDLEYRVINLYYDETAGVITFEENLGGVEKLEKNSVELGKCGKKTGDVVKFQIKNEGANLSEIECGYIKCNSSMDSLDCKDINTTNLIKGEEKEESDKNYFIKIPDDEGDYILYIKTTNESGAVSEYVSNGFFIDKTDPIVNVEFIEKDNLADSEENITDHIGKEEQDRYYVDNEMEIKVKITEVHLSEVKFCITAENSDEDPIEEAVPDIDQLQRAIMKSYEDNRNDLDITNDDEASVVIPIETNANYTLKITATDKAGRNSIEEIYYFTIDENPPENGNILLKRSFHEIENNENKKKGIIDTIAREFEQLWEKFVESVTYTIFSNKETDFVLDGKDSISPVHIFYYISDESMTAEQVGKLDEEDWITYNKGEVLKIKANQKGFVYEKVEDFAGNISYFNSEGIITDNVKPAIQITYKNTKQEFYQSNVTVTAKVEDKTNAVGEEASGLQLISYRVERNGAITQSDVVYEEDVQDASVLEKEFPITIKVENNNSNDVAVYITAVDNAGNKYVKKENIQIDATKPEISVTYNDEQGSKYYNHKRTATITIRERNLDTKDVKISVKGAHGSKASIGKWSHSANAGKSDDATHTCKITFSEDDDYEFSVSCVDMAGNKAAKKFSDTFTLDTTVPVISVSYNGRNPEQNAYYNEAITATITIKEHNFNAGKVNIQTHAGRTNSSGGQGVSGFSSHGDIHTATIPYSTDGIYGLDVTYTDEAGNQAVPFNGNTFTIDITEPELTISNVEDKSANKDEVKPIVTCTDTNYDKERVSITVRGVNSGEVDLEDIGYAVSDVTDGQQFVMDFPKTEERDDVYILTAKMEDRAGNEKESSIEFSVNRYGSVYTLGTETGEWMTNGECAYIKEGKPVVIIETNVDEVVEQNISYTAGGMDASTIQIPEAGKCSTEEKKNGTYFEAAALNGDSQWYQYRYEINAENFEEEGRYTIQIDSTDKAGNHTSNVSNRHTDSNLQVQFAVDQTAPSAVISGAQSGGVYNEEEHTVLLDVQDNLAINQVTVYLNDQEYGTYSAKDIAKMEDGLIPVVVGQAITTQKIQIKAVDMAGNILSRDADGIYDKAFDDFRIIVTRNVFVRFLHTPWLLLLVLFIIACITGGTILIIMKKKKAKQET